MSYRIDVVIPALLIDLTYDCDEDLPIGARVIVPVVKKLYVGFVLGPSQKVFPAKIRIKSVIRIIDHKRLIPQDLWDLAQWSGREGLCGLAVALDSILPKNFLDGEIISIEQTTENASEFRENTIFYPFDDERREFYITELTKNERTLILFPTKEAAQNFFKTLPPELKQEALLWPSTGGKKLWTAWNLALSQQVRIIVAAQGGVFAPLCPQKIIVEDEANPAYIFQRSPRISARDLARRRAKFLGSKFILGGSMPSLRTFLRTTPKESKLLPDRNNIVLTDINYSRKEEAKGIDGKIPITFSLMKRTYRELAKGNNVIWILNRVGNSSEVYCENCGQSIKCNECGGLMRSEKFGKLLRCKVCGGVQEVPEKCPNCGYKFFKGKRPGLEALYEIVLRYYKDVCIYCKYFDDEYCESDEYYTTYNETPHGLILATQRGLELCDKINPSLIAWLDLDSELWRPDYDTQYKVFRMLWESYWNGTKMKNNSERKVLIQSRLAGMKLAEYLARGWSKFLTKELEARQEFMLPPYAYMLEFHVANKKLRESIVDVFIQSGLFVMDPGDIKQPLQVSVDSLESIYKIIEADTTFQKAMKKQSLRIIVRSE